MKRRAFFWSAGVAAILSLAVPLAATAQTWSIDAASTLNLAGDAFANDFNVVTNGGPVLMADTENAYQPNFAVPAGTFDLGNDLNVLANDGTVSSSAGSNFVTVHGELSDSFQVRFQSATMLDASQEYSGNANSFTDASVLAHLSLNPGVLYRVRYDWSYDAAADTDHEGVGEDPESALGDLSFDFGGTAVTAFSVAVDEDAGLATDSGSGSGLFFVLGGAGGSIVDLSVTVDGEAHASFDLPGKGSPPQDLAGSFVFGEIDFVVTALIPEPASWALAAVSLGGLISLARRRHARFGNLVLKSAARRG